MNTQPLRPFVSLNMAMTVDGKITSASREYPTFSSQNDKHRMAELRAKADAIMVGAGTLRADDPGLHIDTSDAQELRRKEGMPEALTIIVVSKSLRLDPSLRFFSPKHRAQRIILTTEHPDKVRLSSMQQHAMVMQYGSQTVDMPKALQALYHQGVHKLLVEGGAELNGCFLEADLFDELYITLVPALLGGKDAPTIIGGKGLTMAQQQRLRLLETKNIDDEIFCRYQRIRT